MSLNTCRNRALRNNATMIGSELPVRFKFARVTARRPHVRCCMVHIVHCKDECTNQIVATITKFIFCGLYKNIK